MGKYLLVLLTVMSFSLVSFGQKADWKSILKHEIKLHGHRNWILIVDAAYPYQGKRAIKTINTDEKQLNVVKKVLSTIKKAPHVSPEIYLDKEIDFVAENQVEGMDEYRTKLMTLLEGKKVTKELHEKMIADIDEAAKTFKILVLKTKMVLPYTSVFIRLDCGYWNGDQEAEMRKKMK